MAFSSEIEKLERRWQENPLGLTFAPLAEAYRKMKEPHRALEILGDDVPDHLKYAGELRVAHKQASLDELGRLAEPVMTKDAIAGRIRRLLAMADKRANDLGIPGTDANVTPEMLDE